MKKKQDSKLSLWDLFSSNLIRVNKSDQIEDLEIDPKEIIMIWERKWFGIQFNSILAIVQIIGSLFYN